MSSLEPYRPQVSGRAARALTRLDQQTNISIAVRESRAAVEAATLDGIAAVAGRAMQDVAMMSQMEQSLSQTVPHASGRLATIADIAALAMADVVAGSAQRLRRC